jgi:hypothetical protein
MSIANSNGLTGAAGERTELSHLGRMLNHMSRSRRRSAAKAKQTLPGPPQCSPVQAPVPARPDSRVSPSQVLELIERARDTQHEAEAHLALLIDHAVGLGVGWPEIAARLGVSRQAARQQYQRRHRGSASRHDRVA